MFVVNAIFVVVVAADAGVSAKGIIRINVASPAPKHQKLNRRDGYKMWIWYEGDQAAISFSYYFSAAALSHSHNNNDGGSNDDDDDDDTDDDDDCDFLDQLSVAPVQKSNPIFSNQFFFA